MTSLLHKSGSIALLLVSALTLVRPLESVGQSDKPSPTPTPSARRGAHRAFVDPRLLTIPNGSRVDVIVCGNDVNAVAAIVLARGGVISSRLWIIDGVAASLTASAIQDVARQPGIRSIVLNQTVRSASMPTRPQVNQSSISGGLAGGGSLLSLGNGLLGRKGPITDLAWPVPVDIGADELHRSGTTGRNVTVAVVDSGVYFSPELLLNWGYQDMLNFVAQVDFTNGGKCGRKGLLPLGLQLPRYCLQTLLQSVDHFGHGSHVAGTVGNRFRDSATGHYLGIAPDAAILSVRVLGDDGMGSYQDVIEGIQFVVANKNLLNIRVMNLSLSAPATVPYFADPLNRAVERAWQAGIVVIAAAGNEGGHAQSITVPGNDPYVITVGALNSQRTAGVWGDDKLPSWSSSGPTLDGFIKPDVLLPGTNIVSFMYNNPRNPDNTAQLARNHPDYSADANLFRMSGTSMATAVASGVAALMLQERPALSPDQVKFHLKYTARAGLTGPTTASADAAPSFGPLQQGAGRAWAYDAVRGAFPERDRDNADMDLSADLAHGLGPDDLRFHYAGPVRRMASDDQRAFLYYRFDQSGKLLALGATDANGVWLDRATIDAMALTWNQGALAWPPGSAMSAGGYAWGGGGYAWGGGGYAWGGGGYAWGGGGYAWGGGGYAWGGNAAGATNIGATRWVEDH